MVKKLCIRIASVVFALMLAFSFEITCLSAYETKIVDSDGTCYTGIDGNTLFIPVGETVIVTDEYVGKGKAEIIYRGMRLSVNATAVDKNSSDICFAERFTERRYYHVMSREGVPIKSSTKDDAETLGIIPYGTDFSSVYYINYTFWDWVYIEYNNIYGWVLIESRYKTADIPDKDSTHEITTVIDGLRLMEGTDYEHQKEISEPIPKGTVLKYDYYRAEYYEGGETSYHTEYKGVSGWLTGIENDVDGPVVCSTTVDKTGYVMINPGVGGTIYTNVFNSGEKTSVSIPEGVPVKYDSYASNTVDKETGEVLKDYSKYNDIDFYNNIDVWTDNIVTCRVTYKGVTGWVTIKNGETGYSSDLTRIMTLEKVPVYDNPKLNGEKIFDIPELSVAESYFFYHNNREREYREFIGYGGKFGWVDSGADSSDEYKYSCTTFSHVDIISDLKTKKVIGRIPPGEDFILLYSGDHVFESTGGYCYAQYKDVCGWIKTDGDYISSGLYDIKKQIVEDSDDDGSDESEKSNITKSPGPDSIVEMDKKDDGSSKLSSRTVIIIASVAFVILAVIVVFIIKRGFSKSK